MNAVPGKSDVDAAPGGRRPITRCGGARLKLSLNAFSFNQDLTAHLKDPQRGLGLLDLLEFCAEQGFDAIDATGYYFPGYPAAPEPAFLNNVKRRAHELGLDISGTGARNDFAQPDEQKRAADVLVIKRWIEVAARMGAPVILLPAREPDGYAWNDVARWMAQDLKACAAHGREFGVIVGVQNHGDMLRSAEQVLRLLDMVDSEWCRPIVDTGFLMTADPYQDIALLAPYAVNWQIKENLFGKDSGAKADLARIVRILREQGYRGYLPLETLAVNGEEYDAKRRVIALLGEMRRALQSS